MNPNEGEPKYIDYETEINNRFAELVENPRFGQIVFLVDMEGVILPLHFSRLIYPEVYGNTFNPLEDRIINKNLRSLPKNETLLALLKGFVDNKDNDKVLIISTSQMDLVTLPKTQQTINAVLKLCLYKTHDILNKTAGQSYHKVTEGLSLKDNSLLISLDDTCFSKTLINHIRESQPNYSTFSALPIRLPPFNENCTDYKTVLYKNMLSGMKKSPVSLNTLEVNEGVFKRRSYSQLPINLRTRPSGD